MGDCFLDEVTVHSRVIKGMSINWAWYPHWFGRKLDRLCIKTFHRTEKKVNAIVWLVSIFVHLREGLHAKMSSILIHTCHMICSYKNISNLHAQLMWNSSHEQIQKAISEKFSQLDLPWSVTKSNVRTLWKVTAL